MTCYLDRNGAWICKYEREGVRVWARQKTEMGALLLAFSAALSACREGKIGDFVVNVYGQLIPRGWRSPHVLWEVIGA